MLQVSRVKERIIRLLSWVQGYSRTDMIYVAKGSFWLILGRAVVFILSFLVMIAFSRFVSKEFYGTYRYLLSLAGLISLFSLPGINVSLARSVAKGFEGSILPALKEKMRAGVLGSLILLGMGFYYFFHQNFVLFFALVIIALFFPLVNALVVYLPFWQGRKRFDIQSKYLVSAQLCASLVLIAAVFFSRDLLLVVISYFASFSLCRSILLHLTLGKVARSDKDPEMIPWGRHLTLMGFLANLADQLDKILLWHLLGAASVAVYSFAWMPIQKMRGFFPVAQLALPKLSPKKISDTKQKVFRLFWQLFLVSCPLALGYMLVVPWLYRTFFPHYTASIAYAQVLSVFIIFLPVSLISTSLVAAARKKELYFMSVLTPLLKIILLLILVPLYKLWGAVYAIAASQFFNAALMIYLYKKL